MPFSQPYHLAPPLCCPAHPAAVLVDANVETKPPAVYPFAADSLVRLLKCPICCAVFPVVNGVASFWQSSAEDAGFAAESRQWDDQAEAYDSRRIRDAVYMAGVTAATDSLAVEAGDLVLDAGCGTGLTIAQYAARGGVMTALDASLVSLAALANRPETTCIRRVHGDLCRLPFSDGVYDRTLCANAIQQIDTAVSRAKAVRELARVTRQGGRVVISVHHYSRSRLRSGLPQEGPAGGHSGPVRYVRRFTTKEFTGLLSPWLTVENLYGAAYPLPYRYRLTRLCRLLERGLKRMPVATPYATMLVAICTPRQFHR